MSFNHEAIAACPVATNADKALIRAMTTRRFAYILAASEAASDFIAADPATGIVPLNLIQNNILFQYDATDSTTVADGVTCLVTSDAKRYKSSTVVPPYSVLTRSTTAQPSLPSVGARYLIPVAATGTDWAGKDNQIGIYTAGGWRFAISPIGRELYVEDENSKYFRNSAGVWTAGVGNVSIGSSGVNITNVLGAKASFVVKVENRTTNAQPASPVAPTSYIIGPSPTGGVWSGNAGKLAICLTNGTWTVIAPTNGDQVYDKSTNAFVVYNGTIWVSSVGRWISGDLTVAVDNTGIAATGGSTYGYSYNNAPTTSHARVEDTGTKILAYSAKRSGALLKFFYSAHISGAADQYVLALFRDSASSAIAWNSFVIASSGNAPQLEMTFYLNASDTSPHDYRAVIMGSPSGNVSSASTNHRSLELQESS